MTRLDKTFTAPLEKSDAPGGWTYVVTDWTADFFGTRRARQSSRHRRRPSVHERIHGAG